MFPTTPTPPPVTHDDPMRALIFKEVLAHGRLEHHARQLAIKSEPGATHVGLTAPEAEVIDLIERRITTRAAELDAQIAALAAELQLLGPQSDHQPAALQQRTIDAVTQHFAARAPVIHNATVTPLLRQPSLAKTKADHCNTLLTQLRHKRDRIAQLDAQEVALAQRAITHFRRLNLATRADGVVPGYFSEPPVIAAPVVQLPDGLDERIEAVSLRAAEDAAIAAEIGLTIGRMPVSAPRTTGTGRVVFGLTDGGSGGDALRRRWRDVPGQQRLDVGERHRLWQLGEDVPEAGAGLEPIRLGCLDQAVETRRRPGAGRRIAEEPRLSAHDKGLYDILTKIVLITPTSPPRVQNSA